MEKGGLMILKIIPTKEKVVLKEWKCGTHIEKIIIKYTKMIMRPLKIGIIKLDMELI